MKKLIGLLVLLSFIGWTGNVGATLIGDTVTIRHDFSDVGSTIGGGPFDVLVQAGLGDLTQPYFPNSNWYSVDVEASSFSVLYGRAPSWSSAIFNGLIISDMDWIGAPGSIVGVNVSTNLAGFDNSRVTFTADSVSINWQSLSFAAGTRWDIDLITTHSVPVPATLILFGLGLAGLGWSNRKKV